ncbi:MAG: hypothetical protein NT010_00315 [Proteobacteria bacterium]|nr:hypothetical protein [Pseudomonadota bacterium]
MGIVSWLTGTDKYGAVQSALIAKYMFLRMTDSEKDNLNRKAFEVLVRGGIPRDRATDRIGRLNEAEKYCLYSMTLATAGIPPALKGILYNDEWYPITNPFVALLRADKQMRAASYQIKNKYGVDLSITLI